MKVREFVLHGVGLNKIFALFCTTSFFHLTRPEMVTRLDRKFVGFSNGNVELPPYVFKIVFHIYSKSIIVPAFSENNLNMFSYRHKRTKCKHNFCKKSCYSVNSRVVLSLGECGDWNHCERANQNVSFLLLILNDVN